MQSALLAGFGNFLCLSVTLAAQMPSFVMFQGAEQQHQARLDGSTQQSKAAAIITTLRATKQVSNTACAPVRDIKPIMLCTSFMHAAVSQESESSPTYGQGTVSCLALQQKGTVRSGGSQAGATRPSALAATETCQRLHR